MLGYSRRCFGGPIRKMLSIFDFDPVCTFWFIAIITILVFFCIWLRNPHLGPFLSFGTSDCKGCRTSIKPTKAHPWSMTHFEPLLVQVYSLVITARRMQVATHASAEIAVCLSVCLCVCHMRALWQNQTMHCRYFDTTQKGNHSILTPTPRPSEICAQNYPPQFEKRRLRPISAYNVSTVRDGKKVQLWRTGSRPRAFQRAIDGVRPLPVNSAKGGSKAIFCFKISI